MINNTQDGIMTHASRGRLFYFLLFIQGLGRLAVSILYQFNVLVDVGYFFTAAQTGPFIAKHRQFALNAVVAVMVAAVGLVWVVDGKVLDLSHRHVFSGCGVMANRALIDRQLVVSLGRDKIRLWQQHAHQLHL